MENTSQNYLITIIGPTAIGKTALSIQLANHFQCNIISSDSRQIYKELTIGTAVPNATELEAAPHFCVQHKSIFENYNSGHFELEALQLLDGFFIENPIQIMVGGSGMYVDAVLKGFDYFPDLDPKIRTEVIAAYEQNGLEYLQNELLEKDPVFYQKLVTENPQTLKNPQRMMRFVEVCLGTNLPYSSFLNQEKNKRNFTPIIIGLEAQRDLLYDRINQRVDLMMQEGLLEEAKENYANRNLNALQTVGYKELFDFLNGNCTLAFAIEEIKKNTRRFAKRQITWFKRTPNVQWFDFRIEPSQIIELIQKEISKN